jgi:hypothetical protein
VWGLVTWENKPLASPVQSRYFCKWRRDVDSEEDLISLIVEAAATWHFFLHTSVSAALLSAVYRCRCPYVWTSALIW